MTLKLIQSQSVQCQSLVLLLLRFPPVLMRILLVNISHLDDLSFALMEIVSVMRLGVHELDSLVLTEGIDSFLQVLIIILEW